MVCIKKRVDENEKDKRQGKEDIEDRRKRIDVCVFGALFFHVVHCDFVEKGRRRRGDGVWETDPYYTLGFDGKKRIYGRERL